ncbi:MAG: AbiEi antitoxin N-terminal domain-containing protein [Flavobacteriales bacterium]|nr:AbiEi antitoxin N-terminal domain-containing protein [Flavobacteriales bacterium]MBS4042165.1 AbiEi antitoxin N-terminal domain-containing protein [Flavobacteriales bacterium]
MNKLLQNLPQETILVSSWLRDQGYSLELEKKYRKSKWLESI